MSDTPGEEERRPSPSAADRRAAFEAEISKIQVKAGRASTERRLLALSLVAVAAGVVVALVAFVVSLGQADTRDVISMSILAVFGLALTVAGAAVFLRYSIGRFLRFWLLRLIYEQRPPEDRTR